MGHYQRFLLWHFVEAPSGRFTGVSGVHQKCRLREHCLLLVAMSQSVSGLVHISVANEGVC